MTQTILIIIGIAVIAILLSRKARALLRTRLRTGKEAAVGICATALDQTVRKNGNKEKILALLREKGQLSNAELREALGISDRSVIRYMDELVPKLSPKFYASLHS